MSVEEFPDVSETLDGVALSSAEFNVSFIRKYVTNYVHAY